MNMTLMSYFKKWQENHPKWESLEKLAPFLPSWWEKLRKNFHNENCWWLSEHLWTKNIKATTFQLPQPRGQPCGLPFGLIRNMTHSEFNLSLF